jgi:hypothetical protein
MSFEAMHWSWPMTGVSPMAKLVAIKISDGYGPGGQFHACSLDCLIKFTCGTEADVRSAIAELVNKAEMLFEERAPGDLWFWLPIKDESQTKWPAPQRSGPLTIYVISRGQFTKIGISGNALKRMESLQCAAPEQKLKLEWRGIGPDHQIRKVEKSSHAVLSAHLVGNEWFAVTPSRAIEVVCAELAKLGVKIRV